MTTLFAQPSIDTSKIWIKRTKALKVLAAADSVKIMRDHIALLKQDTAFDGTRIRELKAATTDLKKADSVNTKMIQKYELQLAGYEEQLKIASNYADRLEADLRKAKRKQRLIAAAGIITTGAAIFFLHK